MLLPVPYNFPGTVKQIIPKGDSSEVILAFDNRTLEISVLITKTAMADLALKENVPAYAAIMWLKEAIPPGSGKKMKCPSRESNVGNNTVGSCHGGRDYCSKR